MNDSKRFTNIIKTAFSVIRSKDFVTSFAHLNWMPSSYCTLNFDAYFSSLFCVPKNVKLCFNYWINIFRNFLNVIAHSSFSWVYFHPMTTVFFLAKCNDFASYQQYIRWRFCFHQYNKKAGFSNEEMAFPSDFSVGRSHQRQKYSIFYVACNHLFSYKCLEFHIWINAIHIAIESIS